MTRRIKKNTTKKDYTRLSVNFGNKHGELGQFVEGFSKKFPTKFSEYIRRLVWIDLSCTKQYTGYLNAQDLSEFQKKKLIFERSEIKKQFADLMKKKLEIEEELKSKGVDIEEVDLYE